MKSRILKYSAIILSIATITIFLSNCVGTGDPYEDPIDDTLTKTISGTISLPMGSTIDVNSLKVYSPIQQTSSSGTYELDVPDDNSVQFVVNANDEIVMMGYNYIGSTNEISATSTAIALIMSSPTAIFLSKSGKTDLVNNIIADKDFPSLVTSIEQIIVSGDNLFDSANVDLKNNLESVFRTAAYRKTNGLQNPVKMSNSGRHFIFNNIGTPYSSVIGIYKDGKKIDKIVVEGIQVFPSSVTEILTGWGGTSGDPVDYSYDLVGDGEFEFKIRTGKPGFGDGSVEHDEAFYENLGQFSIQVLSVIIPKLDKDKIGCLTTIVKEIESAVSNSSKIDASNGVEKNLMATAGITYDLATSLLAKCADLEPVEESWFDYFGKAFDYIGKIGNIYNLSAFGVSWGLADPIVDTCFHAEGNIVGECSPEYKLEIVSGNNQSVSLNTKSKPLKVKLSTLSGKPAQGKSITWLKDSKTTLGATTTDPNGNSQYELSFDKAGNYLITAQFSSGNEDLSVDFQIEVGDSTAWYNSRIPGTWKQKWYSTSTGKPSQLDRLELKSGGKGSGIDSYYYSTGKTTTNSFSYSWEVLYDQYDKRYYLLLTTHRGPDFYQSFDLDPSFNLKNNSSSYHTVLSK